MHYEGFIEKVIYDDRNLPKSIFAYIDFDFYKPIITALKFSQGNT